MNINNLPVWMDLENNIDKYYAYNKLTGYFTLFHMEKITKKELAAAIYIWQQTLNYTEV